MWPQAWPSIHLMMTLDDLTHDTPVATRTSLRHPPLNLNRPNHVPQLCCA
jgi:hypothetical protein